MSFSEIQQGDITLSYNRHATLGLPHPPPPPLPHHGLPLSRDRVMYAMANLSPVPTRQFVTH